jgi:hypothetical protein
MRIGRSSTINNPLQHNFNSTKALVQGFLAIIPHLPTLPSGFRVGLERPLAVLRCSSSSNSNSKKQLQDCSRSRLVNRSLQRIKYPGRRRWDKADNNLS